MRNYKIALLLVLVLTVVVFTFVSCDTSDNGNDQTTADVGATQEQTQGSTEATTEETTEEPTEEHVHVFSDATCTAPKTCACGATEGEALGHTEVEDAAVEPTCTATGLTAGAHCSVCNEVITAQIEVAAKGHSHEATVTAPTCTEAGYTTYTCACGDTYTADEVAATGHSHEASVVEPTCTEAGTTTYTCACGDTYTEEVAALGHSHQATVVEPTCTNAGVTTYTCACGDTYTEEVEKLGHIDADLDISCDREGCTTKVVPTADSTLSLFTANNMGSKISTSNMYYVEGTIVEMLDARNGVFFIADEAGDKFYIRMPKDADGNLHSAWTVKLVEGDKIRMYGKINKFSTQEAPGGYYPAMQSGLLVEILVQHEHDFSFSPADCTDCAFCHCGQDYGEALGHIDENTDNACDRCSWRMDARLETILTHYEDIKGTANVDTTAGTATWNGTEFDVVINKGSSSLNSNATNHCRVQNNNSLTIAAKNGKKIISITFVCTTPSYVDELQLFVETAGYAQTTDGLEVTIRIDSLETVTLLNTCKKVARIATIEVAYVEA